MKNILWTYRMSKNEFVELTHQIETFYDDNNNLVFYDKTSKIYYFSDRSFNLTASYDKNQNLLKSVSDLKQSPRNLDFDEILWKTFKIQKNLEFDYKYYTLNEFYEQLEENAKNLFVIKEFMLIQYALFDKMHVLMNEGEFREKGEK